MRKALRPGFALEYREVWNLKKGDFLWAGALALVAAFLLMPATHNAFISFTSVHPFISGFIKFFILATMGELLAIRIVTSDWSVPRGMIFRAAIWGFLGMAIVLIFDIFASGIKGAMGKGLIPGGDSKFLFAFFTSSVMNLTFAPTMMAFHRVTDTIIDVSYEKGRMASLSEALPGIDWTGFISFAIMKTIPLFWIPAHTVTFLLPPEYRVLMAAMLSIALGAILAFAKKKPEKA